ncbi:DUF2147 domain-containing protein [Erythrobacter sp. HKB08]|uniref:DUF2147 domain-containing protein n=1 Tax=Erythrobacter sp. HKB08 TaxID=2502843 RepID=UPI001008C0ED|nr:DUF2147 domain-containing protein [Erythrobacter sp. HKB08]
MRKIALALAFAGAALTAGTAQASPASIEGKWKTDDGRSVIAFYKCGNAMCGRIDRFLVPEPAGGARDTENPKAALRDRKLLGLRIFWDLTADGSRFKGEGYSPEDGRYFDAQVWRSGNTLKVKGCVLLFCRTANFTRA